VTISIEVAFGFENTNLGFGKVDRDEVVTKLTALTATDARNLIGLDLVSSSEFITASIADGSGIRPDEKKVSITVKVDPGLPLGRFNESITAKSSIDSLPDAILRVSGTIIGPVEVSPESVRFVLMQSSENSLVPEFHKVRIINHVTGRMLSVISAQDPDGRMNVELKTIEDGREFELTVRPKSAESIAGTVKGTIVIVTDHPDQRELTLAYTVISRL
jgi:hypothetical protein